MKTAIYEVRITLLKVKTAKDLQYSVPLTPPSCQSQPQYLCQENQLSKYFRQKLYWAENCEALSNIQTH